MVQMYVYAMGSVVLVSLISLIGLVLLSLQGKKLKNILFLFVALAIGALLGDAFIHLIPEALEELENPGIVSLLVISGIFLFFWFEKILHWHHGHHGDLDEIERDRVHPVGTLILWSDSIHNFLDGLIIGASFMAGIPAGVATTVAVLLHEIPQEIGDFGVLLHAGYSQGKALLYNLFSALTAIFGVLLVIVLGESASYITAYIIPFAAGTFIYIASADLVPELHRQRSFSAVLEFIAMMAGVGAMYFLLFLE